MDIPNLRFPEGDDVAAENGTIFYSAETEHTRKGIVSDAVDDSMSGLSPHDIPGSSGNPPNELDAPLQPSLTSLSLQGEPPSDPDSVDDFLFELDAGVERSLDPLPSNDAASANAPSLLKRVTSPLSRRGPPASDGSSTIAPSIVAPSIGSSLTQKYAATLASAGAFCFEYLHSRSYRVYSVRTFCESLFHSSRATDATIASVKRYGDRSGVPHRFLIFHIVRKSGRDFYLRVDRRRDHGIPLWMFGIRDLGRSNAVDTVAISGELEHLHDYMKAGEEAVMLFPTPPPLITTAQVLYVIAAESQNYNLTKENCWFFASMIQEILMRGFGAQYQSGVLNHPKLAKQRRAQILRLVPRERGSFDTFYPIVDTQLPAWEDFPLSPTTMNASNSARVNRQDRGANNGQEPSKVQMTILSTVHRQEDFLGHLRETSDPEVPQDDSLEVSHDQTPALPVHPAPPRPTPPRQRPRRQDTKPTFLPQSDNVLSITLHRLTRFIDTFNDLSRAGIISLKLRTQESGQMKRYYMILRLRSITNANMWLRLEPTWKSFGEPFLKQGVAGLSSWEVALTREGDLEHEHVWQTANPPTLHVLQHALCVISDSLSDSLKKDRSFLMDGSLFCSMLFAQWGIEWPKKTTPTFSERGAQIFYQVAQSLQQLALISLPVSVPKRNPGHKMVPTAREFISESSYDSSLIYGLTRYRKEGRAHHEFVIIHTVDKENHDQWFRFDGAANTSGPSRFAVASSKNVGASDQIVISFEKQKLFHDKDNTIQQVVFMPFSKQFGSQPTVGHLRKLLRGTYAITSNCNLLKENCRFVTSVIQEGLMRNFTGKLLAGKEPTWFEQRASRVAQEIFEEFERQLGGKGSGSDKRLHHP